MIDVLAALGAELLQTELFSAGLTAQDVVVSSAFFTGEKYGFGLLLAFSHRFTPGSGEPEKRLRLDVNCLSFLTNRTRQKRIIIPFHDGWRSSVNIIFSLGIIPNVNISSRGG